MKHRLFIASFIQPDISHDIRLLQERFICQRLKLNAPENFHITYSFLGLRREDEIFSIKKLLPEINEAIDGVSFHLADVMCFEQHGRSPVVLRLELSRNISSFIEYFQHITGGDKKTFVPHITIAKAGNDCLPEVLKEYKKLFSGFRKEIALEKAVLAESVTAPEGSVYQIL